MKRLESIHLAVTHGILSISCRGCYKVYIASETWCMQRSVIGFYNLQKHKQLRSSLTNIISLMKKTVDNIGSHMWGVTNGSSFLDLQCAWVPGMSEIRWTLCIVGLEHSECRDCLFDFGFPRHISVFYQPCQMLKFHGSTQNRHSLLQAWRATAQAGTIPAIGRSSAILRYIMLLVGLEHFLLSIHWEFHDPKCFFSYFSEVLFNHQPGWIADLSVYLSFIWSQKGHRPWHLVLHCFAVWTFLF